MNKKVSFGTKPIAQKPDVDSWVERRAVEPEKIEPEKMKRLTIDISASLHAALKSSCALRGTKIADEVRELLYEKYGKS